MGSHSTSGRKALAGVGAAAAAAALVAVAVLAGAGFFRSPAVAQVASAGGDGRLFAVAGQLTDKTYGLYLVNGETGIIAIYEWLPGKPGALKLVAARNCTFDLQLDEYNTEPSPREIMRLVREGKGLAPASPE